LALAEDLAHPHSLAYVSIFAAITYQLRGEPQMAQLRAEAALKLATEHGFLIWKSMGKILQGWSIANQARTREGIALIQQGIAMWQEIGAAISLPYYLSLLAEAYGRDGNPQKGIEVLDKALSVLPRTGDRWWEAELYRLKGDLVLQVQRSRSEVQGQEKDQKAKGKRQKHTFLIPSRLTISVHVELESASCFQQAREVARKQRAKSLELRAAISLARLWKQQQKEIEAQRLVAEVYDRFTEGFETSDLQQAKTLMK
jgi:predicted ATPase